MIVSMALPLTAEQEAGMGNCALEGSASSNQTLSQTLFGGVITCLEQELGEESARVAANNSETLTATQQAALGGCLVGSALGGFSTEDTSENPGSDFSSAVVACLEKELGVDLANVVVCGVVLLNAGEQAALGRCLLEDAINGGSSAAIRPEWESATIMSVPLPVSGR